MFCIFDLTFTKCTISCNFPFPFSNVEIITKKIVHKFIIEFGYNFIKRRSNFIVIYILPTIFTNIEPSVHVPPVTWHVSLFL